MGLRKEIRSSIEYLKEFRDDAIKEKNKDKEIAYNTCIAQFEDLLT